MSKFRKKPVVIEAFQIPPVDESITVPLWFVSAILQKSVEVDAAGGAFIKTLEGTMRADVGDWVIQGVKGELYPVKHEIFAATYEAV